jgi:hypothetical protein
MSTERSRLAAKLIFADFKLSDSLMNAWADQDPTQLRFASESLLEAEQVLKIMRAMPAPKDKHMLRLQSDTMDSQDRLAKEFRKLCELSQEGLNLSVLQRVKPVQRALVRDLSNAYRTMVGVHDLKTISPNSDDCSFLLMKQPE